MHQAEWIGSAYAGKYGDSSGNWQDLSRHLDDDLVGVTVRHEAGQRPVARHAEAARVVDHNQVRSARLGALGRDSRACARADDWETEGRLLLQT